MHFPFYSLGFGKAYYPPAEVSSSIVLADGLLDHALQPQLFTVSGPRERIVLRKNYPETWMWDHTLAGYTFAHQKTDVTEYFF
jgi:hypothetical protein